MKVKAEYILELNDGEAVEGVTSILLSDAEGVRDISCSTVDRINETVNKIAMQTDLRRDGDKKLMKRVKEIKDKAVK